MHQSNFARLLLLLLPTFIICSAAMAQYGDFGLPEQPADSASVDDIVFYGDYMDMSGGYNVDDTVYNFTVYDYDGNPVELYEELAGPKPVILVSGSVSCIRFRNVFDPNIPGQEVWSARNFIYDHIEDYNWIFIYGVEAHPTDGNCPSNCPPTVNTDTAVVQPSVYAERRWAMQNWQESPNHDFPFTMYADNPDNALYNTFFQRPFGLIALNCDGTVGIRADWVTTFFNNAENVQSMIDFRQEYLTCTIDWQPEDGNTEDEDTSDEETDENSADDEDTGDDTGDDDDSDDEDTGDDTGDDDEDTGDDTSDDDSDDDEPSGDNGPDQALNSHSSNEVASNLLETIAIDALHVYPNPARAYLTVASNSPNASWSLTDMQGREVAEWTQTEPLSTFSVGDLPRGHYTLTGRLEDGSIRHRRVILR